MCIHGCACYSIRGLCSRDGLSLRRACVHHGCLDPSLRYRLGGGRSGALNLAAAFRGCVLCAFGSFLSGLNLEAGAVLVKDARDVRDTDLQLFGQLIDASANSYALRFFIRII